MEKILFQFGLEAGMFSVKPFGNGLINSTWLVENSGTREKYVLQKINRQIFKNPEDIAFNIGLIDDYLKKHFPKYLFASPQKTTAGKGLVISEDEYFRMFFFVSNSHTIDVVEKPQQAYEAARQFGRFTKLLSGLDTSHLKITLPDFHNLSLRYHQFEQTLEQGNTQRIKQAGDLITAVMENKTIVEEYEIYKAKFTTRCTHHDTKISNVLFDIEDIGLCVIDLDTVMPGYFISDLGDMMRTYLCPVSEEEKDFSKIIIRKEFYESIVTGYLSEMGEELTAVEKNYIHFAGKFMIYMQAMRFLTDHLNDDFYYGAKYEGQNFIRAGNQVTLLKRFEAFNPG